MIMKFEINSKYNVNQEVYTRTPEKKVHIIQVKLELAYNMYHFFYLVETEDGERKWLVEDRLYETSSNYANLNNNVELK